MSARVETGGHEQLPLQFGVVDLRRSTQILGNRRAAHTYRLRDRPHARAASVPRPQYLSNLPHRQSLAWHRVPIS
jgi:hypothetical protein